MGLFDSMKEKAEELLGGAQDAAASASDTATDAAADVQAGAEGAADSAADTAGGWQDKAGDLLAENADKVEQVSDLGLEKGGAMLDEATGGKFGDQIEQGKSMIDERIGE